MWESFVVTPRCDYMVVFRISQERVSFADGNDNLFPFHLILKPPEHLSNFPHPVSAWAVILFVFSWERTVNIPCFHLLTPFPPKSSPHTCKLDSDSSSLKEQGFPRSIKSSKSPGLFFRHNIPWSTCSTCHAWMLISLIISSHGSKKEKKLAGSHSVP